MGLSIWYDFSYVAKIKKIKSQSLIIYTDELYNIVSFVIIFYYLKI